MIGYRRHSQHQPRDGWLSPSTTQRESPRSNNCNWLHPRLLTLIRPRLLSCRPSWSECHVPVSRPPIIFIISASRRPLLPKPPSFMTCSNPTVRSCWPRICAVLCPTDDRLPFFRTRGVRISPRNVFCLPLLFRECRWYPLSRVLPGLCSIVWLVPRSRLPGLCWSNPVSLDVHCLSQWSPRTLSQVLSHSDTKRSNCWILSISSDSLLPSRTVCRNPDCTVQCPVHSCSWTPLFDKRGHRRVVPGRSRNDLFRFPTARNSRCLWPKSPDFWGFPSR